MRENDEDWYKQLINVLVEITGLNEIFLSDSHFLQLLSKLEGLKQIDLQFEDYRRIVFESISLLQGFLKNYE